jgi:hypothetical protein
MSPRSLVVAVAKSVTMLQVYIIFGIALLLVFTVAMISAALSQQPGEALKGLAEVIKGGAWPIVVAVLLLSFRGQIAEQVSRITKVTTPVFGIVVEIEPTLREAKQDAVDRGDKAGQVSIADVERAGVVDMLVTQANLPQIRIRFETLADEYESVRSSMPSGYDRTRAMGGVTAQMRALGRAAYPLRWEFAFSRSPGRRLGTLAMLQVQPDLDMLEWVTGRVSPMEAPYIQYHALQALLAAARLGDLSHATQIFTAYRRVEELWKSIPGIAPDRKSLLKQIKAEVEALKKIKAEVEEKRAIVVATQSSSH